MSRETFGEPAKRESAEVETSTLFSSIAHDLRTPLTSIKAASTTLLRHESELDQAVRMELLETIRDSADSLDRLIGNALQISRGRAGVLEPKRVSAAIDEVASRTLEQLRHRLRDHRVLLVIPEDLPEVPVDVTSIDQVLTNLLENAARFSPPGTEIAISMLPRDGHVLIRVEDHGPGIPAHERERVFEPFVKLAPGGGAGLGLTAAKAIAQAHGGRITIEDARGGGTAVVMELPRSRHLVVPELSEETLL
ncbi:MAG: sensor histidine kinase [Actinomycetota bacterium]